MDPWEVAAPRFGGAAALPMEIEGKAAGGRAAAAHLVVVCCVGTQNPRKCSFLPRNVTLVCRFVPIVSNIFVWFMSTGCVTMQHKKYY
jgi:hypothetical protein